MAKKKAITQEELKRLFEKTKKSLQKFGRETNIWLRKGEVELSRLSRIGKIELNLVNLNMKKEKLLKDIGKRIVDLGLGEKIGDAQTKNMCDKVYAIVTESKRKKSEMSRLTKRLLKGGAKKKSKK